MLKVYETVEIGKIDEDTDSAYVFGKQFLIQLNECEVWDLLSIISSRILGLSDEYQIQRKSVIENYNFMADLVGAKHWEDL